MILRPQPGPQEAFLSTAADIAIYGGAAFGGKTFGILMDPLRGVTDPGWSGVIFRRTSPQITNDGGLWDTSEMIYSNAGGTPVESAKRWEWPAGPSIRFAHMQHEKDKLSHQGAAYPFIGWDELTHFSKSQFFYLLSRNRLAKPCKFRPYMRATCNPECDSWVKDFIQWWLDENGFPIPERSGVLRYFVRKGDAIHWADTPDELFPLCTKNPVTGELVPPKSLTFIPSRIEDNELGMANDPDYLGNLEALPLVEREKLRHGNWNVRPVAGMFFQRTWFDYVDVEPKSGRTIRYWDRAATEPSTGNPDPDWTVGTKVNYHKGIFTICDVRRFRKRPEGVLQEIIATSIMDGEDCEPWLELDPAQAGKAERAMYQKEMIQCPSPVRFLPPKGSKAKRALMMSAQAEARNIKLVTAPWNKVFLEELEAFADWDELPDDMIPTKLPHDDQVDTVSGAGLVLVRSPVE